MAQATINVTSDIQWQNRAVSSWNNGSAASFSFGFGSDEDGGWFNHAMLKFDLSSIPAGAMITRAVLQIYGHNNPGGGGANTEFRRVTTDFSDATASNAAAPGLTAMYDGIFWETYWDYTTKWTQINVTHLVRDLKYSGGTGISITSNAYLMDYTLSTKESGNGAKLVVDYDVPGGIKNTLLVQEDFTSGYRGVDEYYNDDGSLSATLPNSRNLWMENAVSGQESHANIKFNLSGFPSAASILAAYYIPYFGFYGTINADLRVSRITGAMTPYTNPAYTTVNEFVKSDFARYNGSQVNNPQPIFNITQVIKDILSSGSNNGFAVRFGTLDASTNGYPQYIYSKESTSVPAGTLVVYANTAPNPPSLITPVNGSISNNRHPTFSWTFSDPDAGHTQSAFQIQVSTDSSFTTVNGWDTGKIIGSQNSYVPTTDLGDNQWYYRIRTWDQVDFAGGWSSGPWFGVENTLPTVSGGTASPIFLNVASNGTFRVQVTGATDNWSGVQNVRFAVWTEVNGQDDLVWYDGVNDGGGTWHKDIPLADHGNIEGLYHTHVYAYDNAGNSANVRQVDTTIDRTLPVIGSIDATKYVTQASGTVRMQAYNVTDTNLSRVGVFTRKSTDSGVTWSAWSTEQNAIQTGTTFYFDLPITAGNGRYQLDFRAYDAAGNVSNNNSPLTTYVYQDAVKPADPNGLATNVRANDVTFTWNAFSDTAPSSGYLRTQLYVRKNAVASSVDIDSNGSLEDFITFTDNRTSYVVNGLLENTSYSFLVTHYDKSGNESLFTWKTVQTNTKTTASLQNLDGSGYLINQKPKFRVSGNDLDGSLITFKLQVSNNSDFSTTIVDSVSSSAPGWSNAGGVGNGVVNTYTPQVNLGTGVKYIRVQGFDGQEWGPWSVSTAITVQNPNWVGTIQATDKTASKRWIDDLRSKVNNIRQARGLADFDYTDPFIRDWNDPLGGTLISATHIIEIRQAIQEVATLFGNTITWTHSSVSGINRSGQEWLDLRTEAEKL